MQCVTAGCGYAVNLIHPGLFELAPFTFQVLCVPGALDFFVLCAECTGHAYVQKILDGNTGAATSLNVKCWRKSLRMHICMALKVFCLTSAYMVTRAEHSTRKPL